MGVSVYRYKVYAFVISAGFAGLAGNLYAYSEQYISPNSYNFELTVLFSAITTLVAEEAIVAMLWCSAYQTRRYPAASARRARATLAAKLSVAVSPRAIGARSRMESGRGIPRP